MLKPLSDETEYYNAIDRKRQLLRGLADMDEGMDAGAWAPKDVLPSYIETLDAIERESYFIQGMIG